METLKRFLTFLRESWHEVRHQVTYPSKEEVKGTATVVLLTSAAFACYLFSIDYVMTRLIRKFFEFFA